jgi:hypothetical protein
MDEQVTERGPSSQDRARRTARKDSTRSSASLRALLRRAGPAGLLVLALGLAAAALLIVAEGSTVQSVETELASCEDLAPLDNRGDCVKSGGEKHGGALYLIGIVAGFAAFAAGVMHVRVAAYALLVLGLVALGIGLIGDLPDVGDRGSLGAAYEQGDGEVKAGIGLTLELIGGALCVAAGMAGLRATRYQRP